MGQKWIIDVLADLEAFARDNNLPNVADSLSETAKVARSEIRTMSGEVPNGTKRGQRANRDVFSEA